MKEEITTAGHKTLKVSKSQDTKHRAFSLLTLVKGDVKSITEDWLENYDLTMDEVKSAEKEFQQLTK